MAIYPISDHLGGDGVLNCGDLRCEVCWLWPHPGERRSDWLNRIRAQATLRFVHLGHVAPPALDRWSSN
jgi:hypothetical protein